MSWPTFSLDGLCFGLAFRSEAAVSAASGTLVILGFQYGYVQLARYPLTQGFNLDTTTGPLIEEAAWIPVANVVVWTLIFAALTTWLVSRGRARQ